MSYDETDEEIYWGEVRGESFLPYEDSAAKNFAEYVNSTYGGIMSQDDAQKILDEIDFHGFELCKSKSDEHKGEFVFARQDDSADCEFYDLKSVLAEVRLWNNKNIGSEIDAIKHSPLSANVTEYHFFLDEKDIAALPERKREMLLLLNRLQSKLPLEADRFSDIQDFQSYVNIKYSNRFLGFEDAKKILGYQDGHGFKIAFGENGLLMQIDEVEKEKDFVTFGQLLGDAQIWSDDLGEEKDNEILEKIGRQLSRIDPDDLVEKREQEKIDRLAENKDAEIEEEKNATENKKHSAEDESNMTNILYSLARDFGVQNEEMLDGDYGYDRSLSLLKQVADSPDAAWTGSGKIMCDTLQKKLKDFNTSFGQREKPLSDDKIRELLKRTLGEMRFAYKLDYPNLELSNVFFHSHDISDFYGTDILGALDRAAKTRNATLKINGIQKYLSPDEYLLPVGKKQEYYLVEFDCKDFSEVGLYNTLVREKIINEATMKEIQIAPITPTESGTIAQYMNVNSLDKATLENEIRHLYPKTGFDKRKQGSLFQNTKWGHIFDELGKERYSDCWIEKKAAGGWALNSSDGHGKVLSNTIPEEFSDFIEREFDTSKKHVFGYKNYPGKKIFKSQGLFYDGFDHVFSEKDEKKMEAVLRKTAESFSERHEKEYSHDKCLSLLKTVSKNLYKEYESADEKLMCGDLLGSLGNLRNKYGTEEIGGYAKTLSERMRFEYETRYPVLRFSEKFFRNYDFSDEYKNLLATLDSATRYSPGRLTINGIKKYIPLDADDKKEHILIEYDTTDKVSLKMPEDELFNIISEYTITSGKTGMQIEVNPIMQEKSGTIEEYLEKIEQWRKEDMEKIFRQEGFLTDATADKIKELNKKFDLPNSLNSETLLDAKEEYKRMKVVSKRTKKEEEGARVILARSIIKKYELDEKDGAIFSNIMVGVSSLLAGEIKNNAELLHSVYEAQLYAFSTENEPEKLSALLDKAIAEKVITEKELEAVMELHLAPESEKILRERKNDFLLQEKGEAKNYEIGLWPGSGYTLNTFGVRAGSDEEALEKTVAYIIDKGYSGLYTSEEEIRKLKEDDEKDGEEIDETWEDRHGFLYVDATMEGAPYPVYLNSENMKIVDVEKFGKETEMIMENGGEKEMGENVMENNQYSKEDKFNMTTDLQNLVAKFNVNHKTSHSYDKDLNLMKTVIKNLDGEYAEGSMKQLMQKDLKKNLETFNERHGTNFSDKEIIDFAKWSAEQFEYAYKHLYPNLELTDKFFEKNDLEGNFGNVNLLDALNNAAGEIEGGLRINGVQRYVPLEIDVTKENYLVEYEGDISEDGLFNMLSEQEITDKTSGLFVDVNPITPSKSGTIDEYIERIEQWRKEDMEKSGSKEKADEKQNDLAALKILYEGEPIENVEYRLGINTDYLKIAFKNATGDKKADIEAAKKQIGTEIKNLSKMEEYNDYDKSLIREDFNNALGFLEFVDESKLEIIPGILQEKDIAIKDVSGIGTKGAQLALWVLQETGMAKGVFTDKEFLPMTAEEGTQMVRLFKAFGTDINVDDVDAGRIWLSYGGETKKDGKVFYEDLLKDARHYVNNPSHVDLSSIDDIPYKDLVKELEYKLSATHYVEREKLSTNTLNGTKLSDRTKADILHSDSSTLVHMAQSDTGEILPKESQRLLKKAVAHELANRAEGAYQAEYRKTKDSRIDSGFLEFSDEYNRKPPESQREIDDIEQLSTIAEDEGIVLYVKDIRQKERFKMEIDYEGKISELNLMDRMTLDSVKYVFNNANPSDQKILSHTREDEVKIFENYVNNVLYKGEKILSHEAAKMILLEMSESDTQISVDFDKEKLYRLELTDGVNKKEVTEENSIEGFLNEIEDWNDEIGDDEYLEKNEPDVWKDYLETKRLVDETRQNIDRYNEMKQNKPAKEKPNRVATLKARAVSATHGFDVGEALQESKQKKNPQKQQKVKLDDIGPER